MTRNERQEKSIQKWLESKGKSSIIAATGFGKTVVAMKIIQRSQVKNKDFKVIVIVPKINLKQQWEEEAVKFGVNIKVFVINSIVIANKKIECDLLVVDENSSIFI